MKGGWIVYLGLCLCLAGCGAGQTSQQVLLPDTEPIPNKRLVFLLDRADDGLYRAAAENLAVRAEDLSGGSLTVEIRETDRAVADFNSGKGQLAFVDNLSGGNITNAFSALSDPMRYRDYSQFTMTLNSQRMLAAVNENLERRSRALMLAAFYQGGTQLLSAQQPVGGRLPVRDAGEEDWALETSGVVALRVESPMEQLMEEYGMDTRLVMDPSQRVRMLIAGEVTVAEFDAVELLSTNLREGGMHLISSNHSMSPMWLAVDRNRWNGLAPSQQAALREAVAYLFPIIDQTFLDRDLEAGKAALEQGIPVYESFEGLKKAMNALDEQNHPVGSQGRVLVDIIDETA